VILPFLSFNLIIMRKALQNYTRRLQATSMRGFSIAEVLIAIVIITILTIGSISVYSAQLQKARDTERKADVDRIRGYLDEIVGRFGTPPGEDASRKLEKIGDECSSNTDLFGCFKKLQMSTVGDLVELVTDPREEVPNDREDDRQYEYLYGSTANSYRICAMLEDQGALDVLNFSNDGVEEADSDKYDNLYCISFKQPGGDDVDGVDAVENPPDDPES